MEKVYSVLDDDLYKCTMQYAVMTLFNDHCVRYKFISRGKTKFPKDFGKKLQDELNIISQKAIMTEDEYNYMIEKLRWMPPYYVEFLSNFRYDPTQVKIDQYEDEIEITIEGLWYKTIKWEMPVLSSVSELYYKEKGYKLPPEDVSEKINKQKGRIFQINNIKYADMGTRRRFSFENHDRVIKHLKQYSGNSFVGTSNIYFAKKYGLKAIGTQAHEWYMFHAAKYGFFQANNLGMENWVKVYKGDLGIALSDTFTTKAFFHAFTTLYAKLFDGVRHDSGDPFVFGDNVIQHYQLLGLDPEVIKSKTIIFSDSLNLDLILDLEAYFKDRIRRSYGIGTWLTNDLPDITPLNIVIKMSDVLIDGKWIPTVKLSDVVGKNTGDPEYVDLAKRVLKL